MHEYCTTHLYSTVLEWGGEELRDWRRKFSLRPSRLHCIEIEIASRTYLWVAGRKALHTAKNYDLIDGWVSKTHGLTGPAWGLRVTVDDKSSGKVGMEGPTRI